MNRKAKLAALCKRVNERHGSSTIGLGAALRPNPIVRIPTGSLSLDYALGGGLASGKVHTFYGERSSGKTTTCYRAMGIAQGLCSNCMRFVRDLVVNESIDDSTGEVEYSASATCDCYNIGLFKPVKYPNEKDADFNARIERYSDNSYDEFVVALVDVEASFDIGWASDLGIDNRRLLYVCPDSAEEVIDIYESLIRTGSIDMICLDSIAAMAPAKEIEESTENWQQGLMARLVNKFIRIVTAASNGVAREFGKAPTQLWINQVREKIGVQYGDKTSLPGGKGQRFANSIEVKMWPSGWEREDKNKDLKKDHHMKVGTKVRVNFKIEKNKTFAAKVEGGYDMFVAGKNKGSVDEVDFVFSLAEKYGEIEKVNANKWRLGLNEYKRKGDLLDALVEEPEWSRVRGLVLSRMLGDF